MISACYHGQRVVLTPHGRAICRFPARYRTATIVRLPGPDDTKPAMSGSVLAVWDGETVRRPISMSLLREAGR